MQHHATAAWLSAARKVFFLSLNMSVCLCCGEFAWRDRLIACQQYWRTNWRPFSHLSLAWLSAILMSLFIGIFFSPFTSPPLWRDLQCDCEKHLSFSFYSISLLLVALAFTRSVAFFLLLGFFVPFSAHCPYPSFYCGVFLSPALFQPSLQNDCDWHFQAQSHSKHDFKKCLH